MDHRRHLRALTLLAAALVAAGASAADLQPPADTQAFLPVDEAFQPDAWAEDQTITLAWQMAPGYYLYRHAFRVNVLGDALPAVFPPGETRHDEFFGEVETYSDQVFATLPLPERLRQQEAVDITVRYQGCAEAGLCYPPVERTLHVRLP